MDTLTSLTLITCTSVVSVALAWVIHPEQSTMIVSAIIGMAAPLGVGLLSLLRGQQAMHRDLNSRLTQALTEAKESGYAQGVTHGAERERLRSGDIGTSAEFPEAPQDPESSP